MARIHLCLIAFGTAVLTAPLQAAEIKVVSAGAVRSIIAGMIDDYSRTSGQKFDFTIGTTGQLRVVIESGYPADLVIVSSQLMSEMEKTGNLVAGSRTDLGRVGMGVAIKEGAPAPDVSTAEAFKKTLLDAKSVAVTDPSAGGTTILHLLKVFERFGITDTVMAKAVKEGGGKEVSEAVAAGRAEIGLAFISEIVSVKGVKLAAPLPPGVQEHVLYTTAIPKASADPVNARAFIAHLTSAGMAQRWTSAGFEAPK